MKKRRSTQKWQSKIVQDSPRLSGATGLVSLEANRRIRNGNIEDMNEEHSIFWQRLDVPGHDACRLRMTPSGWQLDGSALFLSESQDATQLRYSVQCDRHWQSIAATIDGWIGSQAIGLRIRRESTGDWTLNECPKEGLAHCIDLDLGFTPATNLIALRRLNLAVGQAAEAPAAWLDIDSIELSELQQSYQRTGPSTYRYASPRWHYEECLEVDAIGFVHDYPALWRKLPSA